MTDMLMAEILNLCNISWIINCINTVFRSACPAGWETGAWGACELDCTGQQSSGQVVATNEQDKLGHTTFGQEGGAKQKRASIGSAMSEKWATCEAGCGEGGKLKRKVICRWFLIDLSIGL